MKCGACHGQFLVTCGQWTDYEVPTQATLVLSVGGPQDGGTSMCKAGS